MSIMTKDGGAPVKLLGARKHQSELPIPLIIMILPKNWTSGLDGALQVKLIH